MTVFFKLVFLLQLLILLVSCTTLPGQGKEGADAVDSASEVGATDQEPVVLPFPEPAPSQEELDADVVFSALVGEIATQRGQLDMAYKHQLQTAVLSGDATAAERATRIALVLKRPELALKAVEKWVELAPNNLTARQLAAALFLQDGRPEQTLQQLQAIIDISEARGEDGFLHAMAALSKAEDRPAAMGLMRQLTASYPADQRAGYALAMMALMWKDYPLAEAETRKVIEQNPEAGRAYVLLSRVRVAKGDREGALRVLREAVERKPDDLLLNAALARLLVEAEEYEQAYQQFLKVDQLQPGGADLQYSLGVLALQLDRLDEAARYFQKLQESGERPNEVAYYLGRIEEEKGRSAQAIASYERVKKGDFQQDAQVRIARILAQQGKLQESRERLRRMRLQWRDQEVQLYLIEAEMLRELGAGQEVLALYDEALQAHPDNHDLLYARALYAVTIDRLDLLESDLRRILAQNPDHVDALNALGYTLADQTDRYQEALGLITRAFELKPDAPAILDSMGWIQYRLGNYPRALGYLQQAFEQLQDSEIAAHLGEVLWVTGQRDRALQIWQEMLKKDPQSKLIQETMQRLMQ